MGPPSFVAGTREGAFHNWTEDEEAAELRLPLPPGTRKQDLKAVVTPTSLSVALRGDPAKSLLEISPLRGRIVSDETTWFLEEGVMVITLAKMQGVGSSSAAQLWGRSLAAPGPASTFSCWLTPAEVAAATRRDEAKGADAPPPQATWTTRTTMAAVAVVAVAVAILLLPLMGD